MQEAQVQSLVGELRSHIPHAQKIKNKLSVQLEEFQQTFFKRREEADF